MVISRIVSGGQTGADRAALDAAMAAGLPCGGWCPKGRLAEDGAIPGNYQLRETPETGYASRTEANARDSDATVVFTRGAPSGGSLKTVTYCKAYGRPCLHIDIGKTTGMKAARTVAAFVEGHLGEREIILNVAGSRESQSQGIYVLVKEIISLVLSLNSCGGGDKSDIMHGGK